MPLHTQGSRQPRGMAKDMGFRASTVVHQVKPPLKTSTPDTQVPLLPIQLPANAQTQGQWMLQGTWLLDTHVGQLFGVLAPGFDLTQPLLLQTVGE